MGSPLADAFTVDAGTGWTATGSADFVHVESYAADGTWVGHADDAGIVPAGATYGIACSVSAPFIPAPLGTWTCQDGF